MRTDLPNMERIYVTREGLDKMRAEFAACKERSARLAETIEFARSLGDLRENGDYHAAREEQALVQARIRDIEDKLARVEVVGGAPPGGAPGDEEAVDSGKAYFGATVKVLNRRTQRQLTYMLVSPVEMDVDAGKISIRSPIGQALLGRSVGDVAVAKVPSGHVELEILEVSR